MNALNAGSSQLSNLKPSSDAGVSFFSASTEGGYPKSYHEQLFQHLNARILEMVNNRKHHILRKISDRIEFISQKKDDWDECGSKAPKKIALRQSEEVLKELYDMVESKRLKWLTPFISSDEDGWVTIVWHGNKHTLHINIEGGEIEYVKVWIDGANTYLDVGVFNNDNRLTLWKWLTMNENQIIENEEILYRNVRGNLDDEEYRYDEHGRLRILDKAFRGGKDRQPSVDRAKIVANDPHKVQMDGSGVVSLVAGDIRRINYVATTIKDKQVRYCANVIFSPTDDRPAHSHVVVTPDFLGSIKNKKRAYYYLCSALASRATEGGWTIPPPKVD